MQPSRLLSKAKKNISRLDFAQKPFIVKGEDRMVGIHSLKHPIRNQSVTIVPVPRFALKSYYNDWCYQPYMRQHTFISCYDVLSPLYIVPFRLLGLKFPSISFFHPANMPGPLELSMTRKEYFQRVHFIKTSIFRLVFLTASYRDRNSRQNTRSGLQKLFDPKCTHKSVSLDNKGAKKSVQTDSYVLVVNVHWVPHALEFLEKDLGFKLESQTIASVGPEKSLSLIESVCDTWNLVILAYFAFVFLACVIGTINYFVEVGREEWLREQEKRLGEIEFQQVS